MATCNSQVVAAAAVRKPHAVCIPLPCQSHIMAMLKLAKLLHFKGFHITFVNTEFNHQKVLMSRGPDSLKGLPDFRFETIPDGLPPCDVNATQDAEALFNSITKNSLVRVRSLIAKLNQASSTPVSCIVGDGLMSCTVEAAQELGIPGVVQWPISAIVLLSYLHSGDFLDKDESSLDKIVGFTPGPGGMRDIRLKDLTSLFYLDNQTTSNTLFRQVHTSSKASSAIILNTFDAIESEVLDALKPLLPPHTLYTVGPLNLLEQQIPPNQQLISLGSNLLEEHEECLEWLDTQQANTVVYVNFGSLAVITQEELVELAWGLANCKHPFLWVFRPNSVMGEAAVLPPDFIRETSGRAIMSGWCPQDKVLAHPSTACFLTHCGWNSIMDTVCGGVPIIGRPFFADQQINCRIACVRWGIETEMDKNVTRDGVEALVREVMEGDKGKEMKSKSMEWKKSAEKATKAGGSSYVNLDKLVKEVLLVRKK